MSASSIRGPCGLKRAGSRTSCDFGVFIGRLDQADDVVAVLVGGGQGRVDHHNHRDIAVQDPRVSPEGVEGITTIVEVAVFADVR